MYDICKYSTLYDAIIQRVFHVGWKGLIDIIDRHRREKTPFNPLYKIDTFLIDLNLYILTKN
jgi:hypothetical protein